MFRKLNADEIDIRVQSITAKGAILLLYKDARVDQVILDETVGPLNWQRSHSRDNQNCTVSIWCDKKNTWVSKEDTGTESNTEKQKGLASDSFKRACFNWGIGRELYTSPFVFVNADKFTIKEANGKFSTYDKFEVTKIEYNGNNISLLTISKVNGGKVFEYNQDKSKKIESPKPETKQAPKPQPKPEPQVMHLTPDQLSTLIDLADSKGVAHSSVAQAYKKTAIDYLTVDDYGNAILKLSAKPDKQ